MPDYTVDIGGIDALGKNLNRSTDLVKLRAAINEIKDGWLSLRTAGNGSTG